MTLCSQCCIGRQRRDCGNVRWKLTVSVILGTPVILKCWVWLGLAWVRLGLGGENLDGCASWVVSQPLIWVISLHI